MGDREKSEVIEGDPDRAKVVEGAGRNGKRLESIRNQRDVDTNALRRDRGPGGHLVEEVEPGDVEDDRERQSDGNGDDTDWIRGGMDDATSGASGESKRLDTRPLAETDSSQHERCEQRERRTAHVPEPSTPPPEYHRRPTDQPNPPHRRGRIKTISRQVSQTRSRRSLTISNGHVAAVSDDLEATDIPYRHGGRYLRRLLTCVRCCRAEESRSSMDGQYNH